MYDDSKKSGLLRIGELSNLTRASVKSLRYYEEVGVLKPTYVDPVTNYRYYDVSQISRVNLIRICVEEGLPLDELDRFLEDEDIVQAGTFFQRIAEIAYEKYRRSYETMLRMDAYQKEYDYQVSLKTEKVKTYTPESQNTLLAASLDDSIAAFTFAQYNRMIAQLFNYAHEADIIALAQQGLHQDGEGNWYVFMQVMEEPDLDDKVGESSRIRIMRFAPMRYRVRNIYASDLDGCFKKAIDSDLKSRIHFIIDGWTYSLVTGTSTVNVLYT